MNKEHLVMNANPIVVALEKPSAEFTKADIIDYIVKNDIRMVNFMYPGGDGKLKLCHQRPGLSRHDTYLWRACGRQQPVLVYPGRFERPLCIAPLPHSFCGSFRRDSYRFDALFVLR